MEYTTFIFLGKPGSGKGIQAKLLGKKTGFEVVSSGERFREIASHDTIIGHKVKGMIESGLLMPHWFASYIFLDKTLNLENKGGIIFDGAARKEPEAELFHDVMSWLERPYKAIYIDVSDEEVVKRIMKRREIEDRHDDDSEEIINTRLREYYDEAQAAIGVFKEKGNFLEINGEQSIEKIHEDVIRGIETA
ncbi:MAG: nucleoside monophosphate kinase [Candidatus Pacebacteria bacterium]|nr:nucleoside monophosphate kinase [Candidatus Paceibacterota bacterium]